MSELQLVCRGLSAREPSPADNRVKEQPYPAEDGKIGFSLAPTYSRRQLREIKRRIKNEVTFRTPKFIVRRHLILTGIRLDPEIDDILKCYHKNGGGIE